MMISRFLSFVIIFTTHLVDLVVPDGIMGIYRWNFRGYRTQAQLWYSVATIITIQLVRLERRVDDEKTFEYILLPVCNHSILGLRYRQWLREWGRWVEAVVGLHHAACMKLRHVFTYKAMRNQHWNGHFWTKIEEEDIFFLRYLISCGFGQKRLIAEQNFHVAGYFPSTPARSDQFRMALPLLQDEPQLISKFRCEESFGFIVFRIGWLGSIFHNINKEGANGVPNCQSTTNFLVNCQLTTNLSWLLIFISLRRKLVRYNPNFLYLARQSVLKGGPHYNWGINYMITTVWVIRKTEKKIT